MTDTNPDEKPATDTPFTEVGESDPNADSRDGLAGDLGVSSERRGPARGVDEEVTYGAAATHPEDEADPEDGVPPEQSAYDGQPEVNPDSPGPHVSDPDAHPGHGV